MSLSSKVAKLERAGEQAVHRRRVAELVEGGMSPADAELVVEAERRSPPVPVPGGGYDLEPTIRTLAELRGDDPEQLVAEVRAELRGMGVLREGARSSGRECRLTPRRRSGQACEPAEV